MNRYIARCIDRLIERDLSIFGAVLIQGPKWCGKTTTAQRFAASSLSLSDPAGGFAALQLARLDPAQAVVGSAPRLIDEWQEEPKIWDAYAEFVIDAPASVLQVLWDFPAHFLDLLLGSPTRVGITSHHAVDICVEEVASAVLGTGDRVMRWERGGLYPRFLPLVTAILHVLQNAHGDFFALLVDAGEFSHCHLSSPSSRFDPENLSIERALSSES